MKITADQYLVKKINKSLVLHIIMNQSPISKPQLEKASGLNKGTISRLVNELVNSKLINEVGIGKSTGGRKPSLYSLNYKAGYTLGIEVKADTIYSAIADLSSDIINKSTLKINPSSFNEFLNLLTTAIDTLVDMVPSSAIGITGLGIAFPGLVDQQGDLMIAPSSKWHDAPLKSELSKRYDFPIYIENDARLGLIGEKKFGNATNATDILYVTIGKSIGSGITINNKLMRGSTGFSGQAGHFSIQADGIDCICGNKGCWQLYASTKAITEAAMEIKHLKEILLTISNPLDYLIGLAKKGNEEIIQIFNQTGTYIGIGLVNLINLLNPEMIIIAGEITDIKKWIYDDMMNVIKERALHSRNQNINICFSQLGINASLVGAISYALQEFFNSKKVPL